MIVLLDILLWDTFRTESDYDGSQKVLQNYTKNDYLQVVVLFFSSQGLSYAENRNFAA